MAKFKLVSAASALFLAAFAGKLLAQPAASSLQPYLIEEAREMSLARSAATAEVTAGAAVYVLRADGYHLAAEGDNGFACLVQRSFTAPTTEPAEFHDPRLLAPICFAPDAAATVMQRDLFIARLVARGTPLPEIRQAEAEAYASGILQYPDTAVFAYMLSSAQWLGPGITHWRPHVMVWAPGVQAEDVVPKGLRTFGLTSGLPVLDTRYGPKQTLIVIPVTTSVDPGKSGPTP